MNGLVLESVNKERDIGIVMENSLQPSLKCAQAARRATRVLNQITKAFLYRDRVTFLRLYTQFVRCHLEFAVTPGPHGQLEIGTPWRKFRSKQLI